MDQLIRSTGNLCGSRRDRIGRGRGKLEESLAPVCLIAHF